MPGTRAGEILPSIQEELGVPAIPVFTVAEHDTGSAVAAVPALTKDFAYLSCGTWSLMGTEVTEPVLTDEALELNFTNEGGVGGTYRLLKNIMGLWLLEECRRTWLKAGQSLSYEEMIAAAQEARPFRSLIDPDVRCVPQSRGYAASDPRFLPGDGTAGAGERRRDDSLHP